MYTLSPKFKFYFFTLVTICLLLATKVNISDVITTSITVAICFYIKYISFPDSKKQYRFYRFVFDMYILLVISSPIYQSTGMSSKMDTNIYLGIIIGFYFVYKIINMYLGMNDTTDTYSQSQKTKYSDDHSREEDQGNAKSDKAKFEKHSKYNSYTDNDLVEMNTLYKKLARKYHPDFARSEEDKKFRTELMKKINNAKNTGDVKTLKLFDIE